jgi:hypothetical protein
MNSRTFGLVLLFAASGGTLQAQGLVAQQAATEPSVAEIGRVIGEREKGNWREPIEYFSRFTPKASSVNGGNVAVWDAYLQLRVETWFERSQQWKTRDSVAADAERAIRAGQDYFEWYRRLTPTLLEKLPKTPADSPYANVTAPGRIRFGVAVFGNALLELGRPRDVLQEFATMPDDWFGDEGFRIWITAAIAGSSSSSRDTFERVQENVRNGRVRPEDVTAFLNKLDKFFRAWEAKNSATPLPPRWQSARNDLKNLAPPSVPGPSLPLSPRPSP